MSEEVASVQTRQSRRLEGGSRLVVVVATAAAMSALLFNTLAHAQAGAQDARGPIATVGAFGSVGLGGAIGYDNSRSDKLVTSFGFGAQFTYALHRYFALGVLGRYWRWRPETMPERFTFVEGAVVPRGQYVFRWPGLQLRVFLQVPVGVGWTDMSYPVAVGAVADSTNSPVFVVGVSGGAELFFTRWLGVFAEVGWLQHVFSTKVVGGRPGERVLTTRAGFHTDEAVLQLGVIFALIRD